MPLLAAEVKLLYLNDLWICILVASVLVFVVSCVLHVLLPIHKGDYHKLPNESGLLAAMRELGVTPGTYSFPFPASMKDMASPEMAEKYAQGPVGLLTVLPNRVPAIAKNLLQWFIYLLIVHVLIAYLSSIALEGFSERMLVFRFTSSAALLAFSIPSLHESIWKGQSWIITAKYLLDGVVYALASSLTFAILWPSGQ
jgi:hypothetical protein